MNSQDVLVKTCWVGGPPGSYKPKRVRIYKSTARGPNGTRAMSAKEQECFNYRASIVEYVTENPNHTAKEIAAALSIDNAQTVTALYSLVKGGTLHCTKFDKSNYYYL